jgi:hypothetical protein
MPIFRTGSDLQHDCVSASWQQYLVSVGQDDHARRIVTEWDYRNPHPQIYFDVKDKDGTVAHWATELLPTPLMLKNLNAGWSRTTVKPKDHIILVCNPSRVAGAKACLAKRTES